MSLHRARKRLASPRLDPPLTDTRSQIELALRKTRYRFHMNVIEDGAALEAKDFLLEGDEVAPAQDERLPYLKSKVRHVTSTTSTCVKGFLLSSR